MNQRLQFPAELNVNLASANVNNDPLSELLMFDAVADGEAFLHGIGARRARRFDARRPTLLRPTRGRAARRGFGGGFAIAVDMIASASETFHARDLTFVIERGDNMLAVQFAFSTAGFNITAELWTCDNTKWLVGHQFLL